MKSKSVKKQNTFKKVSEIRTLKGAMSAKKKALLHKQQNDKDFPYNVATGKMTDNPIY